MSYLVFARKFRPQSFDQVMQQEHVTRTLTNAITAGRVPHAILFTGPRGTGKTTVARILAKAMNCVQGPTPNPCNVCRSCQEITSGHAADVFEIDGASNNSVDQVRELRENLKYLPSHGRYKIYIIDEVHMLSTAAFNALLKTLEEPPAHVLFIFATTEVHKIPVTILSRCQRHDLRRIDTAAIVAQMRQVCDQEEVKIDAESLALIATEAGGSMRDALSLLDHVLACAQGGITVELVAELLGAAERKHLLDLSAAVFSRDIQKVLEIIDHVWRHGLELKRFYTDLLAHFHQLAMINLGDKLVRLVDRPEHEIRQMKAQVREVPASFLLQVLDLLFQAEPSIKLSSQPKLALEMVFFKLFQAPPVLPIETLIERLDQLRISAPQTESASLPPSSRGHALEPSQAAPAPLPREAASPHPAEEVKSVISSHSDETPADVAALWAQMMQKVGEQRPSLAAFLNKCRIIFMEGDQATLEVNGNEFTYKSIQKNLSYLEEIGGQCAARSVKFKLTANGIDAGEKQKERQTTDRLKQEALGHPLVMASLELFNGKIVEVKVQ
ncbi:MAG: DNA polymerase III subunit gamma/tau [Desulfobacteraceae bacterium]|nr:DNA polymerase III subunit gamma/tau [Desulfobacteraceae bacterium]